MKLVLAEKPSVAQSIAKVLGATKREDGYLEGNGYVVSWCVGHLVELAQPEVYDAKYSKWAYADLPIFPMDWQYEVSAGTKKQFGILKKLMAREDVASLVCATDAGRVGEDGLRHTVHVQRLQLVGVQRVIHLVGDRLHLAVSRERAGRVGVGVRVDHAHAAGLSQIVIRERAELLLGHARPQQ